MTDPTLTLTLSLVAASYTRQVHDRIEQGFGPPSEEEAERMMEEAFAVADTGLDAVRSLKALDDAIKQVMDPKLTS